MEQPGAAYFYTIATVAITFVTFSSLLIVLRQAVAGDLSPGIPPITRFFMENGFIVVVGALLAPLMGIVEAAPDVTWRVSSGATAILMVIRLTTWPAQRRRQVGRDVPPITYFYITVGLLAALILLANAAGIPWRPSMRLHALGLTLFLFDLGASFLSSTRIIADHRIMPASDACETTSSDATT